MESVGCQCVPCVIAQHASSMCGRLALEADRLCAQMPTNEKDYLVLHFKLFSILNTLEHLNRLLDDLQRFTKVIQDV